MNSKQSLVEELEKIFAHTAQQTVFRNRSNEYLYKGLAWVYLWWVRASKVKGFLDEQYKQHNIGGYSVAFESSAQSSCQVKRNRRVNFSSPTTLCPPILCCLYCSSKKPFTLLARTHHK